MIRIVFVCHGNICRSPMAEVVFKDMLKKAGSDGGIFVSSAATSTEEIGNGVHYGTKKKLASLGLSAGGKRAVQLTREDCDAYDYIIGMDSANIRNILKISGSENARKVSRLLDFTNNPRDIADPWYTGNFDKTYEDIAEGCEALFTKLGG